VAAVVAVQSDQKEITVVQVVVLGIRRMHKVVWVLLVKVFLAEVAVARHSA
jgi:hypothetical protein